MCVIFYNNSPKKKHSGNTPPAQADAEIFNMEVDGVDHVSVFSAVLWV